MKASILFLAASLFLCSCSKMAEAIIDKAASTNNQGQFIQYTIRQGSHYCQGNQFKMVDANELKFSVIFDSSAIYRSVQPRNQFDINKLFGFSDNNSDHHQYSARFGWRWSDNALRLFAYVYNQGVVASREMGKVKIGQEVNCTIKTTASQYIFIMDEHKAEMPRLSATLQAKGYQLYPYFGGDEITPHEIKIRIREIN